MMLLLGGLGGLVVLFVIGGLVLPRRVHIERSACIEAAPEAIYPLVASFSGGWVRWTPFAEPGKTVTFDGPETGVGATQRWTQGRRGGTITITSAEPRGGIAYRLDHGAWQSQGRLALAPEGRATRVTWTDDAELSSSPAVRWMGLMAKGILGAKFDRGLASLKQCVEA
jgi:hypothetical protein